MKFKFLFIICFLGLLTACGKSSGGSKSNPMQMETDSPQDHYRVILTSLNNQLNNKTYGTATINVVEDNFEVKVNLTNAPSNIRHIQSIHAAGNCPEPSQDLNQDSYIDVQEGMTSFGRILIPLDSDLSSQEAGLEYAPSGSSYRYVESTLLTSLMTDLRASDANPNDELIKIKSNEQLNLDGRTFVILGVANSAQLPETVASMHELSREATLPIACGKIVRVKNEGQ